MCRMILAHGQFDAADILLAARKMARGEYAVTPAPSESHPDGYGLLWQDPNSEDGFRVLHSVDDLGRAEVSDILARAGGSLAKTRFLAVHARHATLRENLGTAFCHPLRHEDKETKWFFMHNGFLPTIHHRLGQESSQFDSAEYFRVVVREHPEGIDSERLTEMLESLSEPHGAANFISLRDSRAWAYNWWPEESAFSDFYALRVHSDDRRTIVASDPIDDLAAGAIWHQLERGGLMRFDL